MRKQIAAFALTTATIGGLAIGAVPAANADQISNAITNVTTTGDAIVGDNVVLHANWAVPDYSKAGDTFTLELPTELVPLAKNFPLTDEAGNVVANAVVQDGLVTVTLSDFVTTHPINVHGDLTFSVRISSQAVPGKPITLNWGGTATVITPEDDAKPPVAVTEPVKYGWPTDDSQVGWGFDVPGSMDNVVLSDIPKDVKLKCDTLYVGHADQSNGYPTAWTPVDPSQYSVNCSPDGFSLTMSHIEANDLVHVLIYSTPTAGMDQATNTWALSADGEKTGGMAYSAVYEGSGTGGGEAPVVTPSATPSETPSADATTPSSVTPPTPVVTTPAVTPSATPSETPTAEVTTPAATPSATPSENPTAEVTTPAETPSATPSETPGAEVTTPAETPSATATTPAAEATPTASKSAAVAVAGGTPGSSTGAEVAQPAATPSTVENIVNEAQNNAPAVTGDVQPAQGTASAEESLAYTGFSGAKIAAVALGLLALGTVIVVAARRRQA